MKTDLGKICERFRSEVRRLLLGLAISRTVTAALALAATAIAVDWTFRFEAPARWVSCAAFVVVTALVAVRALVWPRRREWTDHEVLSTLDAAAPQSHDRLVVLHESERRDDVGETVTEEGRAMLDLAVRDLARRASGVDVEDALDRTRVRRWQRVAAAAVVIAICISVVFSGFVFVGLTRLFLPFVDAKWPTMTTLEVVEPNTGWRIPQGEDFRVETRVLGQRPAEIELVYRSRGSDYWITEHVGVDADGQATYTLEAVDEPVTFYLRGGDDRTRRFTVDVIEKPRITRITASYAYPPYADLPDRRIESGQIRGLEGTVVKIDFECSSPLRSAVWAVEGQPDEPLTLTSASTFSKTLQLRTDAGYGLKLTDLWGFREYRPERYDIQVIPDEPPAVRMVSPDADVVVTRQACPRFAFEATDDFGLDGVKFMYIVHPKGEPAALSDRITGPIAQRGKESRAEFSWDFSKMGFTGSVEVECWVTAADCRQTGEGVSESEHRRISVLDPTDFQLRILYEARAVLAEARVAYRNQKLAYHLVRDWAATHANGNTDDARWAEIVAKQDLARRATEAVKRWLDELAAHVERNGMEDAFMKGRLAVIEDLRSGASGEISAVAAALDGTRPRNAAEASPERLKTKRLDALREAGSRQERATVALGRMLRKMYDWENLQTVLVNTQLLRIRQVEIAETTRTIAPRTIGREAEDLDEKTLEEVLLVARQQTAVMETEANLEAQLAAIALKASADGRRTVQRVLLTAYGYLRDVRVADTLKQVARRIAANQLADVANDHVEVVTALRVVEGGLIKAGRDVETDDAVSVADLLKREDEDVESARVEPPDASTDETSLVLDETAVRKLLDEVVPIAEDDLSRVLTRLAEDQDNVRGHTVYLAKTLTPEDIPRYRRLKLGMLRHRQRALATRAAKPLAALGAQSDFAEVLAEALVTLARRTASAADLLDAADVSEASAALQGNVIETARDITQFLARQKQVRDLAAEHGAKGGVDDFNRQFLLKGDDLARALDVYARLDWCRTRQRIVERDTEWLAVATGPDATDAMKRVRESVKGESARLQTALVREIAAAKRTVDDFGDDVKARMKATGLADLDETALAEVSAAIAADAVDDGIRDRQGRAVESMRLVLRQVKDRMDERVAPVETATVETPAVSVTPTPDEKTLVTEEEVAKESTPEAIRADLETTARIAPAVKTRMLQQLPDAFPGKYRRLIGAYFRTLLDRKDETPAGEREP